MARTTSSLVSGSGGSSGSLPYSGKAAALARPAEAPPETDSGASGPSRERDAELRFRALREHLLEIHQQEAQERNHDHAHSETDC